LEESLMIATTTTTPASATPATCQQIADAAARWTCPRCHTPHRLAFTDVVELDDEHYTYEMVCGPCAGYPADLEYLASPSGAICTTCGLDAELCNCPSLEQLIHEQCPGCGAITVYSHDYAALFAHLQVEPFPPSNPLPIECGACGWEPPTLDELDVLAEQHVMPTDALPFADAVTGVDFHPDRLVIHYV
jgi:hypothetical protein